MNAGEDTLTLNCDLLVALIEIWKLENDYVRRKLSK